MLVSRPVEISRTVQGVLRLRLRLPARALMGMLWQTGQPIFVCTITARYQDNVSKFAHRVQIVSLFARATMDTT